MQRNPESETTPEIHEKQSLKKGAGLLLSISAIATVCFILLALWINWPKARIQPEPLSQDLKAMVDRIPGKSDALIYIGLKDIRESRLWNEIIPDSLKKAPLFQPAGQLDTFIKASKFNPTLDIDTLLISFKRHGYKGQNYLGLISGPLSQKLPESFLRAHSTSIDHIGGHTCYGLDNTLWLCSLSPRRIALSNNKKMLEEFLLPTGSFFKRDTLSVALIDKAVYKSHLWFSLPSAAWTSSALQSLTSTNEGLKTMGNLNRIENLALSVKFKDGIEGQSEWVYKNNQAAYFASTFLWGAIKLSGLTGTKTTKQTKGLLDRIHVQQNLKSVIIHTDLPMEIFLAAKQKK
jgi:hypothetical protein